MAADEKILARIHKLLSLATSDNPNEAALAASKAQTLLMEHNISEQELEGFSEHKVEKVIEVTTNNKNRYNRTVWQDILAGIVAHANLCDLLTTYGGQIWIGKPTNIEVAQYIFENLIRDLTRICESDWKNVQYTEELVRRVKPYYSKTHGKTWKNNFYHGANQSIRTRLNANLVQLKEVPSINAMVLHNDVELDDYMKIHHPYLTHTSHKLNHSRSGFESGKAAGASVQFRSGIGAGGSSGPKLIKG